MEVQYWPDSTSSQALKFIRKLAISEHESAVELIDFIGRLPDAYQNRSPDPSDGPRLQIKPISHGKEKIHELILRQFRVFFLPRPPILWVIRIIKKERNRETKEIKIVANIAKQIP